MRLSVATAMGLVLILSTIAGLKAEEGLQPKQQASNLAVPEASQYRAKGAIVLVLCKKVIALNFVDDTGGLHDQPIEGLTPAIIGDLLSQVPAANVYMYTLPCGAVDGTPL